MPTKLSALAVETAIALSDFIVKVKAAGAGDVIVTFQNLIASINANQATGAPLQTASTNFTAVATGTTVIPYDDTPPQITEGTEFMTLVFTPKSTTNRLSIEVTLLGSSSVANGITAALFQDAIANALAVDSQYMPTATGPCSVKLTHDMVAGTVSPITFRVRCGSENAGTFTLNGASGGRKFGGITLSNIKVTEYKG